MSDWTIDTLKEYFEGLLTEKDKALAAALVAVKEENRKTEAQAEKRFDLLNELRQGVATKDQLDALEKIVIDLSSRITRGEGTTTGSQLTTGKFIAALGVVSTVLGIVVVLANYMNR